MFFTFSKAFKIWSLPEAEFDAITGKQTGPYNNIVVHVYDEVIKEGHLIRVREVYPLSRREEAQWDRNMLRPVDDDEWRSIAFRFQRKLDLVKVYHKVEGALNTE